MDAPLLFLHLRHHRQRGRGVRVKHAERQGRSAYVSRAGSARPAAPVQPRGTLGRGDRRHLEISKNATNVDNSLYSILLRRTPAGGRAPPPSAIGPTPPPRSQRAPSALPRHSAEIATPGALAVRRGRQTGHPKSASRPRRPPSGAVPGAVPRRSSPGRRPRRGPGTTKGRKARPVERSAAALRTHGRAGCCCFAALTPPFTARHRHSAAADAARGPAASATNPTAARWAARPRDGRAAERAHSATAVRPASVRCSRTLKNAASVIIRCILTEPVHFYMGIALGHGDTRDRKDRLPRVRGRGLGSGGRGVSGIGGPGDRGIGVVSKGVGVPRRVLPIARSKAALGALPCPVR